ncbi:MAG: DUF1824 family protein [Moorea sp. SIO2B7]|nr:DUF1824 family protein [Moorena sp. SIO2B7]
MSIQSENNLTVTEALKILGQYSCIQIKTVDSEEDKKQLQQALLLITSLSEYENLGVCADNAIQGFGALQSYLKALGYEGEGCFDADLMPNSEEPVYIKFSTQKMSHFLDSYTGEYRGVLVSCQSEENDAIVGTYGHLPLDLFGG